MSQHISRYSGLLMVTDTAMCRKNGRIHAFGPVVHELDVFLRLFQKVTWIGFEREDRATSPVMIPVPEEVNCVLLPPSGGDGVIDKVGVIGRTPQMLRVILRHLPKNQVIHTRAPSSPAFLAALLSPLFPGKIWWHKYAGNWAQVKPPFFYGLQRWWLKHASWSKVTINGRWPGQPAHCLSFENPCLTEEDRQRGAAVLAGKEFRPPWRLCFVGRLESAKGVGRILEALKAYPHPEHFAEVHFVGDGPERQQFEAMARSLPIPVHFHGFLPREQVFALYEQCHFFLLPSTASEGFPKVVAEAANFGCIPLVSDVSSIPHYVQHGVNGWLWQVGTDFSAFFCETFRAMEKAPLADMAKKAYDMAGLFTFERYGQRIKEEILNG